jgi:hypothetical protein
LLAAQQAPAIGLRDLRPSRPWHLMLGGAGS